MGREGVAGEPGLSPLRRPGLLGGDGRAQVLGRLAELAPRAVVAGVLGQHGGAVRREPPGFLQGHHGGVGVLLRIGGTGQPEPGVQRVRLLLQHGLVQRAGLGVVTTGGVEACERHLQPRLLRAVLQHRGQGLVGVEEVATVAQLVGLAQGQRHAQVVDIAPLAGGQRLCGELAQHTGEFRVLPGLQQQRGVAQPQAGAGLRLRGQGGTDELAGAGLVAQVQPCTGHRADQVGVLSGGSFRFDQQRFGLPALTGAGLGHGVGGLGLHGEAALQPAHLGRALAGRDLLQALQRAGPVLQLGLQQRACLQGLARMCRREDEGVDLCPRGIDPVLAHEQLAQRQPHPRGRWSQRHGLLQQRLCTGQITALLRQIRLQAHLAGLEAGLATEAGEHVGVHALQQRALRLGPSRGAQHLVQTGVGARVAGIGAQRFPVGGVGAEELALLGQQLAQQDLAFRLLRVGLDGALGEAGGAVEVADLARGLAVVDCLPVHGRAVDGFPARAIGGGAGTGEQFASVGEAVLAHADDAQAGQRVGLVGALAQHGFEAFGGGLQVAAVDGGEALADGGQGGGHCRARGGGCGCGCGRLAGSRGNRVGGRAGGRPRLARLTEFGELGVQLRVVSGASEVLAEQRRVRAACVQPHQRLAPRHAGVLADLRRCVGLGGQGGQALDRVAARRFAVAQVLGVGECGAGLAGGRLAEALQATAGLVPAFAGAAERLVVLDREVIARWLGAERLLVGAGCRFGLAGLRVLAGGGDQRLAGRLGLDLRGQRGQTRVAGVHLTQPRQVGAGLVEPSGLDPLRGEAMQRVRLPGIDAKQLLPGLSGQIGPAALLPVARLLDELLHGRGARVVRGGGRCRRWRCRRGGLHGGRGQAGHQAQARQGHPGRRRAREGGSRRRSGRMRHGVGQRGAEEEGARCSRPWRSQRQRCCSQPALKSARAWS